MTAAAIEAGAADGVVGIFVDPATAHDLAAAWELAHATAHLDDSARPLWLLDCAALRNAAITADLQNGHTPAVTTDVPFLTALTGGAA